MNKLLLASVSAFAAIALNTAVIAADDKPADKGTKVESKAADTKGDTKAADKKGDKMEAKKEASKPASDCPKPKKRKKHKRVKHAKGGHALWVNAEAPCPVPCGNPTCPEPTCKPTCEPAPCPAPCPPAPTCAPACEPLPATCTPECFGGNTACPYIYHGGYFYYPNASAAMLAGYTPVAIGGSYWYPSQMHPHVVYVERKPVLYVMPQPMNKPMAVKQAKKAAK
jgi:hypothetical protein